MIKTMKRWAFFPLLLLICVTVATRHQLSADRFIAGIVVALVLAVPIDRYRYRHGWYAK